MNNKSNDQLYKEYALYSLLKERDPRRPIPGFRKTLFDSHPLELKSPEVNGYTDFDRKIWFIGNPGYTECSVRGLFHEIGKSIGMNHLTPNFLRRVRTKKDRGKFPPHVYFEIRVHLETFLASGCAEGEGGEGVRGKDQLDGLLGLLSELYQVKIEEVSIPEAESEARFYSICDSIAPALEQG